ncbi:MAG: RHS repeat-associated core domain-containing protein, partial [Salinivirgaceae bacterium]|nr:RHS repeat-associated core domain-containing protein [Salinivirgaceae bacterium]
YNKAGLLERVLHNQTEYVSNVNYNAKGQRTFIHYGNGTNSEFVYNSLNYSLVQLITNRISDSKKLQHLNYTFDAVGNIVQINDTAHQTVYFNNAAVNSEGKYTYDALYRLKTATGRELLGLGMPGNDDFINTIPNPNDSSAVGNYTQCYNYDKLGNFLEMKHVASQSQHCWTREYYYNQNNNYLLGHSLQNPDYTYDAHGNVTSMPHLPVMEWDTKNQLTKAGNGTMNAFYSYDSTNNRSRKVVEKQNGNIREERLYFGNYELFRKYVSNVLVTERTTNHISDGTKRIALVDVLTVENEVVLSTPISNIRYQYDNHLGSSSLELDESAAVISYEEYHAFGTTSYRSGRSETEVSLKRYKYVGKERDEETGLYYYGVRYYAGWIARFISTDPVKAERTWVTPYNYCQNNPINRIDPTGALDGEPPYKGANPELFVEDSTALKSNNGQKLKENPYEVNKRGGLTLAGDISMALDDIRSIVPDKYKSRIKADEKNKISFNVENLTSDDINSDAGLRLLFDIIHKSAYDYKYEVSEKTVGMHRVTGKEVSYDLKAVYGISNLSITPRMKYFDRSFKPVGNFSGHVTIHPNALFFEKIDGTEFQKHRADVVFHELQENFERTDNKLPYIYQDPKNISREDPLKKDLGAHGVAIKKAFYLNDKIKSRKPGEGTTKYK